MAWLTLMAGSASRSTSRWMLLWVDRGPTGVRDLRCIESIPFGAGPGDVPPSARPLADGQMGDPRLSHHLLAVAAGECSREPLHGGDGQAAPLEGAAGPGAAQVDVAVADQRVGRVPADRRGAVAVVVDARSGDQRGQPLGGAGAVGLVVGLLGNVGLDLAEHIGVSGQEPPGDLPGDDGRTARDCHRDADVLAGPEVVVAVRVDARNLDTAAVLVLAVQVQAAPVGVVEASSAAEVVDRPGGEPVKVGGDR